MKSETIRNSIAGASTEELNRIQALLQFEQARRDEERAEREKRQGIEQARRDEERAEREKRQGKWYPFQLAASFAAIAAVIVSTYAIRQTTENLELQRQSQHQQDVAAQTQNQHARYSSISELSLDVTKTIAAHPRLASCFFDGDCDPDLKLSQVERKQAEVLATYIVDFYQYLYAQLQNLSIVPASGEFSMRAARTSENEDWITWSETIVGGFRGSTLLCNALADSAGAYTREFVHAVAIQRVCHELRDPLN